MNNRWKELNEEAEKYALSKVNSAGYCFETNMYIGSLVKMKLAELIVRECINTIDPQTETKWIKDQTQEEFWKNQSVHLIKQRFGIE